MRTPTFQRDKPASATQRQSRNWTGPCMLPLPAIQSLWRAKNVPCAPGRWRGPPACTPPWSLASNRSRSPRIAGARWARTCWATTASAATASRRWPGGRAADAGPSPRRRSAMTVGFTVFARHGDAEFHLRDHGHKNRPPLVTQATIPGMRAVLMGRLYYRADLCARLGQAASELRNPAEGSDAALALALYRQCGLEGLERLEGDFALLIWDAAEQRLIGMRDPMGGYPIFHTVRQGTVAASTHMGALLDSLTSRTLNQEYLADYLMSPGFAPQGSADGRTVYQGIQRVLPGSVVAFHPASGKVEQRRYWDWLQRQVDPGTDDVAKLCELFLDGLRSAVRTRLRGRPASHLSGGMDSTGVALIARDCLQGRESLHALSVVYDRLPGLARERPYVESALEQPGLTPHRINGDEVLDFDRLDTAPLHDEPCS